MSAAGGRSTRALETARPRSGDLDDALGTCSPTNRRTHGLGSPTELDDYRGEQ